MKKGLGWVGGGGLDKTLPTKSPYTKWPCTNNKPAIRIYEFDMYFTSLRVFLLARSALQLRFLRTLAAAWIKSSLEDLSWSLRASIAPRMEHSRALFLPSPKVRFVRAIHEYLRTVMLQKVVKVQSYL